MRRNSTSDNDDRRQRASDATDNARRTAKKIWNTPNVKQCVLLHPMCYVYMYLSLIACLCCVRGIRRQCPNSATSRAKPSSPFTSAMSVASRVGAVDRCGGACKAGGGDKHNIINILFKSDSRINVGCNGHLAPQRRQLTHSAQWHLVRKCPTVERVRLQFICVQIFLSTTLSNFKQNLLTCCLTGSRSADRRFYKRQI